jgi:hypothetical protein
MSDRSSFSADRSNLESFKMAYESQMLENRCKFDLAHARAQFFLCLTCRRENVAPSKTYVNKTFQNRFDFEEQARKFLMVWRVQAWAGFCVRIFVCVGANACLDFISCFAADSDFVQTKNHVILAVDVGKSMVDGKLTEVSFFALTGALEPTADDRAILDFDKVVSSARAGDLANPVTVSPSSSTRVSSVPPAEKAARREAAKTKAQINQAERQGLSVPTSSSTTKKRKKTVQIDEDEDVTDKGAPEEQSDAEDDGDDGDDGDDDDNNSAKNAELRRFAHECKKDFSKLTIENIINPVFYEEFTKGGKFGSNKKAETEKWNQITGSFLNAIQQSGEFPENLIEPCRRLFKWDPEGKRRGFTPLIGVGGKVDPFHFACFSLASLCHTLKQQQQQEQQQQQTALSAAIAASSVGAAADAAVPFLTPITLAPSTDQIKMACVEAVREALQHHQFAAAPPPPQPVLPSLTSETNAAPMATLQQMALLERVKEEHLKLTRKLTQTEKTVGDLNATLMACRQDSASARNAEAAKQKELEEAEKKCADAVSLCQKAMVEKEALVADAKKKSATADVTILEMSSSLENLRKELAEEKKKNQEVQVWRACMQQMQTLFSAMPSAQAAAAAATTTMNESQAKKKQKTATDARGSASDEGE